MVAHTWEHKKFGITIKNVHGYFIPVIFFTWILTFIMDKSFESCGIPDQTQ